MTLDQAKFKNFWVIAQVKTAKELKILKKKLDKKRFSDLISLISV